MFLRVLLGILAGFLLGEGFAYWRFIMPLTRDERVYLHSFYEALRDGSYNVHEDEEENNGPDE